MVISELVWFIGNEYRVLYYFVFNKIDFGLEDAMEMERFFYFKSMFFLELLFILNTIVMNDGNDEQFYNIFYINLHPVSLKILTQIQINVFEFNSSCMQCHSIFSLNGT